MSILTAHNLAKFYGPDEIFSNISLEIPQRARIALVGPNGAGKTTLLNLLSDRDTPTEGEIAVARSTHVGFLPQRPELIGEHTLWEEALTAFADVRRMEVELARLEEAMADPACYDKALAEYGPLQQEFEQIGGYTYESRIRMILQGVGFETDDFQRPIPQLSGGQKTRALLARLLLQEPDLLLLDEPTNHLDIQAVEWLEHFLRDFVGGVLLVSHDRYFMDNFASVIWEMEWGQLEVYRGNYSHYVHQRTERHERLLKEYEAQQEFIQKEEAYIRKHMGSRWTAQAKGRQKKLETMKKRGKIIARPRNKRRDMNLRMEAAMRSGDKVIMTQQLVVGYEDDNIPLFEVPNITLYRGETAALIGPNGVGKSTFLKTIIGQLKPLNGQVEVGASVEVGYFAQAHERLNLDNNLIDEIALVQPMSISEARNYLARYLFTGEDVFRPVATLSGGERGRLALAKLALNGANLLLLDEPTNHLDIDSQEVLEEVLAQFSGTILLVSHDRYLINALATQIWSATPGSMAIFNGTYQAFITSRNTQTESQTKAANGSTGSGKPKQSNKHGLNPFQLKQKLTEIEAQIEKLEGRLEDLTAAIGDASADGNAQQVHDLGVEYSQTEADLEAMMVEWEQLAG